MDGCVIRTHHVSLAFVLAGTKVNGNGCLDTVDLTAIRRRHVEAQHSGTHGGIAGIAGSHHGINNGNLWLVIRLQRRTAGGDRQTHYQRKNSGRQTGESHIIYSKGFNRSAGHRRNQNAQSLYMKRWRSARTISRQPRFIAVVGGVRVVVGRCFRWEDVVSEHIHSVTAIPSSSVSNPAEQRSLRCCMCRC